MRRQYSPVLPEHAEVAALSVPAWGYASGTAAEGKWEVNEGTLSRIP